MDSKDLLTILSIVATTMTIMASIGRWFIVAPLKNMIREQTYPIQPNANGGKSLPDIAKTTVEIKATLESLIHQIDRVEGRLDTHIEQHVRGEA